MQIDPGTARPPIGEEHVITDSDSTIAYYTYGEGDTVVLLASAGRSVSDFNELAVVLADNGYRTVAVEIRNTGLLGSRLASKGGRQTRSGPI